MNTNPEVAVLHAVRADDPLTAADAVAWFTADTPPGRQVIGYALSARAATWLRVGSDSTVETVDTAGDSLSEAYEMVLFDGERELRWLRTPDGRGPAVALGEDPAALPHGRCVTADPPPRRGDAHTRLLAGLPNGHDVAGWTSLGSKRYATVALPMPFVGDEEVIVDVVEYLVEDGHGNVDVADTRTVGLRGTTRAAACLTTTATTTDPKGTPA